MGYLDNSGLARVWSKISSLFVRKTTTVNGKELSSNIRLSYSDLDDLPDPSFIELETYTIQSSDWESTSRISPFKYSTTITSTYDITLDTIIELFNDNPSLFSQYGFALGDIDLTTNEIQIKSVRLPNENVTLTCGFCGGAIENNPTTFESISILNSDWEDLSDSSPFKYQVTKSTTYQFSGDTLVELMNDNPLLFANNGIVIGSLGSSTVTFWCIEKPESSVSLSLSFKG